MDFEERTEMLAEAGLRLILAAFEKHPESMPLSVVDDLELRLKDSGAHADQGRQHLAGEMRALMRPLMTVMIADGIFHAQQSLGDNTSVSLSAQMRAILRKAVTDKKSRADVIRDALDKVFEEDRVRRDGFLGRAREIGFEP